MKTFTFLSMIITAGIIFTSCKKNSDTTSEPNLPPPTKGPYLYVAGSYSTNATFWKMSLSETNSKIIEDSLRGAFSITSVITSDTNVYMAAQKLGGGGYWKNHTYVPVTGSSQILYLTQSENSIYLTGWDNLNKPAYWFADTKTNLQDPNDKSLFPYLSNSTTGITGITVSGSKVYVAGSYFFEKGVGAPSSAAEGNFGILWNQASLNLYGKGVVISAVYIPTVGVSTLGNDVYVAGTLPIDKTLPGGYWKNGNWNPINNGSFTPLSISTFGNNVYIPGFTYTKTSSSYSQKAAYWVNGNIVNLNGSSAYAVTVSGSDIYVLGIDNAGQVVVWKNGTLFKTIGNSSYILPSCMAIGN